MDTYWENIYRKKKEFVEGPLKETCIGCGRNVEDVTYTCNTPQDEEVVVKFIGGHTITINVTATSHLGIAKEVIKAL